MRPEYVQEALEIASSHPEIEAYRNAVARQGRTLTAGEVAAIRTWARDLEVKRQREERDDAMRRLHAPNAT
ncbi:MULTISPECIES: hypothetical protein [unclassified Thioalkalivibrio]|uniref:hypothetical protein n=1 Tax=unclassified Thioalkalivibrio TaxID=2621013 RepID=UPI000367E3D6|nr:MULTISPECIES: hypothetical protein [unclassified Thioalkalivibrio]